MKKIPQHTIDFIDSWLELRYKWENIPGFTVAIAKDGKILFNKSYGLADVEKKEALTTDHIFHIASHSKTFTATAIMQLQEKEKLRIDDAVVQHLPWLAKHTDKRWKHVTIRQLLSHSAGVTRDGLDSDYWQLLHNFPNEDTLKSEVLRANLVVEPNTQMKYSNYGFSLLGMVIEAASGQTYHEYITEHIIRVLGLENTYTEYNPSLHMAAGYTKERVDKTRQKVPAEIITHAMASATGICSTTADLCRYFAAHKIGSGELLSDESKKEMQRSAWQVPHTNQPEYYGLGLEHNKNGTHHTIGHGGGFPGHISQSTMNPKSGITIIAFMNCNGWIAGMMQGLASIIETFDEAEPKPEYLKYEERFTDLWSTSQVVVVGDSLVRIDPNSWWPFSYKEKLNVVSDDLLKISEANGYLSDGELIQYIRDSDGKIEKIVDSGATALPSADGNPYITWK